MELKYTLYSDPPPPGYVLLNKRKGHIMEAMMTVIANATNVYLPWQAAWEICEFTELFAIYSEPVLETLPSPGVAGYRLFLDYVFDREFDVAMDGFSLDEWAEFQQRIAALGFTIKGRWPWLETGTITHLPNALKHVREIETAKWEAARPLTASVH